MNTSTRFSLSRLTALLAALAFALPAFAAPQVPPAQGIAPAAPPTPMPPLPEIKGVVSWNTLAKVKQVKTKDKILPSFSKEVSELNGREVVLQGYMMPLEPGEKQSHFLLTLSSPSCAYCLPAGPEGIVEIKSKTPVKYSLEPVFVNGKLSVMNDDPAGLYYRLTEAAPTTVKQ